MNACADAGKQFAEARARSSGFGEPVVEQALCSLSGAGALALSLSSTEPTGMLIMEQLGRVGMDRRSGVRMARNRRRTSRKRNGVRVGDTRSLARIGLARRWRLMTRRPLPCTPLLLRIVVVVHAERFLGTMQ